LVTPKKRPQPVRGLKTRSGSERPVKKEENKVLGSEGVLADERQSIVSHPPKTRRNALDLKKAVEEEIQELEKKEKVWDIPSFLRNKPAS
jgi:hypothetical protein